MKLMALSSADQSRFEQEQLYVDPIRQASPEKFLAEQKEPGELLKRIGILNPQPVLPKGYIKYSPLDFIVEEIRPNGSVITTDGQPAEDEYTEGEGTIYFDLTKVGLSTIDAAQRLQDALGIQQNQIGYAGIKDAVALTAQRLSLRGVTIDAVREMNIPALLVRNIVERKGAIGVGNLYGNRFTLFIRTEVPVVEQEFLARLEQIQSRGVMNYYGPQRFGTPRFFAQIYGMKILQGDFLGCIKTFLTEASPFEIPFIVDLRKQAGEVFGKWEQMEQVMGVLPYTFRHELILLDALKQNPNMTIKALNAIGPQTNMWVRAYASYLANMLMSEAEASGKTLPQEIPLLLGREGGADVYYAKWLKEHRTEKYADVIAKMRFIQVGKNPTIEPVLKPMIYGFRQTEEGVAICFDLQKGAYATTILMNLIDTVTSYPVPEWMNRTEVDTKKILGTGSLDEVKEKLGEMIDNLMMRKREETEE